MVSGTEKKIWKEKQNLLKFKKKKKNRKKKEDEHDISWSFFISILSLLFSALLCLSYKEMKLYNYDRIIFYDVFFRETNVRWIRKWSPRMQFYIEVLVFFAF